MDGTAIRESGRGRTRRRVRRAIVAAVAVVATIPLVGPATAASGPSATLQQCENGPTATPKTCEWVQGNLGPNNSHYAENDSVPYRLKLGNLATSGTHTVTIEWDPTKAGKHAFDYLTTFSRTEATADPCDGISGCTLASSSTTDIPSDDNVTDLGVTPIAGDFTIWNGTITALSAYATSGSYSGDSSTRITLTFTASASNPVIAWSGHIASDLHWPSGSTASTISGSPYHMRLIEIDGFGGNQDRSMKVGRGPDPGSITIVKQSSHENSRAFSFTASDGLADFTLVDDGDDATAPFNSMTFDGLTDFYSDTANVYDFTEVVPDGWDLSSISCSGGVTVVDVDDATVGVKLEANDDVVCTFANDDVLPTITVTKTATPSSLPEPGGLVTFLVDIDNTSPEAVTLDSLSDSIYGPLTSASNTDIESSTCAVGASIPAGDDYTCTFTANVTGDFPYSETDTVEAEVHDGDGNTATATASATVTLTDARPEIVVDKSASKAVVRVGETVAYTYVVTTPGGEELLDVEVTDDKCSPVEFTGGDADSDGKLDPGESWTYACSTELTGTTTNTATAQAVDDEGNSASDEDTATVKVVDPAIAIDKSASPKSASPGDTVVYTYLVTNPGDAELTAVTVTDDKCSPVEFIEGDTDGDAALDPDETWRYTCSVTVGSNAGSLTNIGTVTATDPTGATVSADDTETITVVLGVTFDRPRVAGVDLPRTGRELKWWALVGAELIAFGAALCMPARRRRRKAAS